MDQVIATAPREFELLLKLVQRWAKTAGSSHFEPYRPLPYAGADRWLLASLVQKSIRRGDIDVARRAARHLLAIDPARLWRRLMVVGLEDIGIGDWKTASLLIALSGLPQARSLMGSPDQAVDAAIAMACSATKERSGDSFCSIAREMSQSSGHSLEGLSSSALIAVMGHGHLPWRRRLKAASLFGCEEVGAEQRKAQFAEAADLFRALGVPELLLAACLLYRGKSDDLLPLFVPLIYCMWVEQGAEQKLYTRPCTSELIGEIPAYGFDPLHTRLGRRAIDVWLKSYLSPPPFTASQVAITVWNCEAAVSRQLLCWSMGETFREQANEADLLRRGLAPHQHGEVEAWVRENLAILEHARRAVWDVATAKACASPQLKLEQEESNHVG